MIPAIDLQPSPWFINIDALDCIWRRNPTSNGYSGKSENAIDARLVYSYCMKYLKRTTVLKYLYDQLTGNFLGFLVGMSATGLVSNFFETRSIKNLWGLTAHKRVVDKETFSNLEWIISIVIGFIVFEIVTKVVKEKINRNFPRYKFRFFRWMVHQSWYSRNRQRPMPA